MQVTSSSMSTLHQVEPLASPRDAKSSLDRGFQPEEYQFDPEAPAPPHDNAWLSRFSKRFVSKHPEWYRKFILIMVYWRGPRPKLELPGSL